MLPARAKQTYIVTLRDDVDPDNFARERRCQPSHCFYYAIKGFAADLDTNEAEKLKKDARVQFIEKDGPIGLCEQANSLGVLRMAIANFPVARINGRDHRINVDVAVLDTGIDANHPDLNVVQSWSAFSGLSRGMDWKGHGTHVAGIIGALDNHFGVVGVAPGARLWNIQVMRSTQTKWSDFLNGIDYVASHSNEISVVNSSLIGTGNAPFNVIRTAIGSLVNRGIVFVAGAGNHSRDLAGPDGVFGYESGELRQSDDALPASLSEAMAVSAMDPATDQIWTHSNFSSVKRPTSGFPNFITNFVTSPGGAIDVAAPGVNILSTWTNGTYALNTGTSMAAPHVTGLVALYIAANGRAHDAAGVYKIRQAIIDASLPQGRWRNSRTSDPDRNPEPLAMPSENWIPQPAITKESITRQGFAISFTTVPGYTYTVQRTDNFLSGNPIFWSSLISVEGTGDEANTVDPNAHAPSYFFRVSRSVP